MGRHPIGDVSKASGDACLNLRVRMEKKSCETWANDVSYSAHHMKYYTCTTPSELTFILLKSLKFCSDYMSCSSYPNENPTQCATSKHQVRISAVKTVFGHVQEEKVQEDKKEEEKKKPNGNPCRNIQCQEVFFVLE